jgi:hypothetical protein
MGRDNGEPGAGEQRPERAFPKGFERTFVEAFAGFTAPYESGARIGFSTGI